MLELRDCDTYSRLYLLIRSTSSSFSSRHSTFGASTSSETVLLLVSSEYRDSWVSMYNRYD